jgi:pimeloyl-ACP methyl ester carboxylesterase
VTVGDADSRIAQAGDAAFSYLEAGSGRPLVLLHGIGSAAASFRCQLQTLSARFRVVAWDAPGYGGSTPLSVAQPDASLYAAALDTWLGALGIERCHLVGQSLGTLVAARFAAEQPRRVLGLTLVGIAKGHGRLPPSERERFLAQRLDDLNRLGPLGMAAKRGPRLLGPDATEAMRRTVIEIMGRIRPEDYGQAAHMLSTGDIAADLARLPVGLPAGPCRRGGYDQAAGRKPGNRITISQRVGACHSRARDTRSILRSPKSSTDCWRILSGRDCVFGLGIY